MPCFWAYPTSFLGILAMAFWIWMLVDCYRNDSERGTWLWILFFFNVPAALIYFVVRKAPGLKVPSIPAIQRFRRRREIWRAEAAARNIGKSHQYTELGDLYRETGQWEKASDAYSGALEREGENREALWGLALCQERQKDYPGAAVNLERLLELKANYAYGEPSLAYGRCLAALGRGAEAAAHLEWHLTQWQHPEARVILGGLLTRAGRVPEARELLEGVVQDARSAPSFHVREARRWARRARKILRRLPS